MPPPVDKFQLTERTFGVLSLTQTPLWASILANPNYPGAANHAGTQLKEVTDGADPQDAVTVAQLEAATAGGYAAIGFLDPDSASCQVLGDWIALGGGVVAVSSTAGGAVGLPRQAPGPNAIKITTDNDAEGGDLATPSLADIKEGRTYATVVAIKVLDDPGFSNVLRWYVQFPSGNQRFINFSPANTPIDEWLYLVDYWVADADAPAGTVLNTAFVRDIGGSGGFDLGASTDLYVGYTQFVEMPNPQEGLMLLQLGSGGVGGSTWMALDRQGWDVISAQGADTKVGFSTGTAFLQGLVNAFMQNAAGTTGVDVSDGFSYHFAEHPAGNLAEMGYEFDVGEDYVPVYLSEKDATTAQLYAGSGNVLELAGDVNIDCGGAP